MDMIYVLRLAHIRMVSKVPGHTRWWWKFNRNVVVLRSDGACSMLRQSYPSPNVAGKKFSSGNALLAWPVSRFAEVWKVTLIEPLVYRGMVVVGELRVHPLCKLLTCLPPTKHHLQGNILNFLTCCECY